MDDNFSILILTKENGDCIINTLDILKIYADKHPSLRQIIISDNASIDNTLPAVMHWIYSKKDDRFNLITHPKTLNDKELLITALEQVTTPITIILEYDLRTRLHQIRYQKKLLRKVDLIFPSRLHRLSKTNYIPTLLHGIKIAFKEEKYPDINNPQKSFRTNTILHALKKNKSTRIDWNEIINENPNIKVMETYTHYIIKK